jgi:hypothetical protein
MLMSDEKLQGMEFTQLLADQQELLGGTWLESCSIWAPKMVESPTKYPSQQGEQMGKYGKLMFDQWIGGILSPDKP